MNVKTVTPGRIATKRQTTCRNSKIRERMLYSSAHQKATSTIANHGRRKGVDGGGGVTQEGHLFGRETK